MAATQQRWMRRPRTRQEKAENGRRFARGKRSRCNLPDDWSDMLKSNRKNRSWKRSKQRNQWQEV